VTDTQVTVNWGAASDDVSAPTALQYRLLKSTANNLDTIANAETNGNEVMPYTANTTTFAAAGLSPCVTYYFAVIVRDAAGNKALYTQQSSTTAPTVSCVSTLAGSTSGNVDGTGPGAQFNNPSGITELAGMLYVSDYTNGAIRQLNPTTGSVTTWVTSITGPEHLIASGSDIFVAGNHCIRKITSGPSMSTFAGSCGTSGYFNATGTSARFSTPVGIVSMGGNFYVGDSANDVIRQITSSAVVVTTYAGTAGSSGNSDGPNSSAQFYLPHGLAAVGSDLYVADWQNHCIRKIATSGTSTLAGNCVTSGVADGSGSNARFRNPRALTTDGSNLYVADEGNHCIRKLVIASAAVTTIAGSCGNTNSGWVDGHGPNARFNAPGALVLYGGVLYVADTQNHRIRKIVLP